MNLRPYYLLLLLLIGLTGRAQADDGYRLWLKYDQLPDARQRAAYQQVAQFVALASAPTPTLQAAAAELQRGLQGLLGPAVPLLPAPSRRTGGIVLRVEPAPAADALAAAGYHLYRQDGNIVVAGPTDAAVLYGAFGLLRQLQTGQPVQSLDLRSAPKIHYRLLNHWDNLNGTVERGYAGSSIWKWDELPYRLDPRYEDYARANASLGLNGVVINNVNASPRYFTAEYIPKVAALAGVLRPYGIRVYLSVYWAAPKVLGGLPTADPLDPRVQKWWAQKADELYRAIPDFGGFLVKANSEGQPGPQDYGRTHADGANMLAQALGTHDGIVMWRAFVYKGNPNGDRTSEAYAEFTPLDGKFASRVLVQVKNGPLDFQPREPFHPLFGAMPKTPLLLEVQITQEYQGFATHLVFLGSMFKEILDANTYTRPARATVADILTDAPPAPTSAPATQPLSGMAGVANIGAARNWTGHPMGQANWYAFGRLAWDPALTSDALAGEWTRMTLTREPQAVATITDLLVRSHDIYVRYSTPMGLHHIMGGGQHYGPEPWRAGGNRPDYTSVYYHKADSVGLGYDRTATGSNALAQYAPALQQQWGNLQTCPLDYLLWFHHVGWNQPLSTGRTLWQELCTRYYTGADSVLWLQQQWQQVQPALDPAVYADVAGRLRVQHHEALLWRDACVLYFQTFARQPIPAPFVPPTRTLAEVKQVVADYQLP